MKDRTPEALSIDERDRRAAEMLDYRREKAEVLAMFEDDASVAMALSDLKATRLSVEKPARESEDYKTTKYQIRTLCVDGNGELNPDSQALVDSYRETTKATVIEIGIKGDVAGLSVQYGEERTARMVDHYQRLAAEAVNMAGPRHQER